MEAALAAAKAMLPMVITLFESAGLGNCFRCTELIDVHNVDVDAKAFLFANSGAVH
jgi:hypothetical protein